MTEGTARATGLVATIVENAEAAARRLRDQATNEGRALVDAADAHVEALEVAARELGRVRGAAADEVQQRDADAEIAEVQGGAFDRLVERFETRVETALQGLRTAPRYAEALRAWARRAALRMDGPTEVHAAPEDRPAVYEALLEAGAEDFQVHAVRGLRSGIVVRDLDGRMLFDARPAALVAEHREALRALLEARLPPPADGSRSA